MQYILNETEFETYQKGLKFDDICAVEKRQTIAINAWWNALDILDADIRKQLIAEVDRLIKLANSEKGKEE